MTLRSVPGSVFPVGEPSPASARHFSGEVYLKLLIDEGITVKNVTFSPGRRNHWHIHHNGGQFLLVTSGHGWYQAWGRPARELHPGDVVCIQGEEKHWHGAAQDSWFQHLCIDIPAPAGHIEWLEPVEGGAGWAPCLSGVSLTEASCACIMQSRKADGPAGGGGPAVQG